MKILNTYRLFAVVFALAVMLGLGFASCGSMGNRQRVITVTIQPQKYFLEKIVGNKFDVVCLLSEGSNPEAYEPSLNHLMSLENGEAYFCMGNLGFELAILNKVHSNTPDLKVFNNSKGIDLLHGTHEPSAMVKHGCEVDPHVWTSVKNAKIISKNMLDAVLELDGRHKKYYVRNYDNLIKELDGLDSVLAAKLKSSAGKSFAIWHPSLSYFAQDYGLHQISLENEGKEMSASLLKKQIDEAHSAGVKILFYQKEFDGRQVETLNRQLGSKLVEINPMNYDWTDEMNRIADAIATE